MTQLNEQLRIIAQPKALYRERYGSEHFKTGNRVQRYIRAEDNQLNFEYPTIEIRREWSDAALPQYIRVASVTVPTDMESIVCVHPYPIYPDDFSIYKDADNNAVYFPITNADFTNGRKSFLLTRKKLLQSALKLHGPLRIVGSGQSHILGIIKKSRSKHLIETYKLWKSQLLFSRVERVSDGIFNLCTNSSVLSQVMSDETNQQHKDTVVPVVMPSDHIENCGMCVPDKGNSAGGDTILMVLNTLNRDNRILLNIIFIITFIFRAKQVFHVQSHALFLSCMAQISLAIFRGPLRLYFYRYNGCLPVAGTPLCQFNVYLIYIPTQINNFLVVQLSIERLLLVVKPLIFHQARHQNCSRAIFIHYIGLFVAIVFPCFYYPIIMQHGAATIDLNNPSITQTYDLWYSQEIYELFDLLITFVPYFLILISCLPFIGLVLYRKYALGYRQGRQVGTRNHHRLLFSLHLFLFWFLLTWSPRILYNFFQTILNLTYSVFIDAITTFIVYLNYTFSSTIVLITFEEMRQFCFVKFGFQRILSLFQNRIEPGQPVRYVARNQHIIHAL
ncbi:unnamed protein product [Adineta steineri]|uniref:G-protein coupled receptors family 1 profile domain-containing protein n=1 Tax=Adineta steineri TaxID=433720 RepID=A0A816ANP8_9BILA|nr:unnamed protein product [Adineta steineri]CAF1598751.1 unnamed protein product [Adineta steineri]